MTFHPCTKDDVLKMSQPRSGYTLPVFACASAVAALRCLRGEKIGDRVSIHLIDPPEIAEIAIEQVAKVGEHSALAITRSDPGDNLDLTRHTPLWAWVERQPASSDRAPLTLIGGEGIGKQTERGGEAAIYRYAQRLLRENLQPFLNPQESITVTLILPEGRQLAERTSNAAFGVIEGLSLLGTTGISQPLTASGQLARYQESLREKAKQFDALVFCVGENGLDLAQQMGIHRDRLIKTANWLGSMLVTAAAEGIQSILLFGYHGKLIKLAGGIFHTHHHLADGRLEIMVAQAVKAGLPLALLRSLSTCPTTEAALTQLRAWDHMNSSDWAHQLYDSIVATIDSRSQAYIYTQIEKPVEVGSVLFDRDRKIILASAMGQRLLERVGDGG